jgi:hypothetical protein
MNTKDPTIFNNKILKIKSDLYNNLIPFEDINKL